MKITLGISCLVDAQSLREALVAPERPAADAEPARVSDGTIAAIHFGISVKNGEIAAPLIDAPVDAVLAQPFVDELVLRASGSRLLSTSLLSPAIAISRLAWVPSGSGANQRSQTQ